MRWRQRTRWILETLAGGLVLALLLVGSTSPALTQVSPADSTSFQDSRPGQVSPDSLRGTRTPLEADHSFLRRTGHLLLTPPFLVWQVLFRPVAWLAEIDERYHLSTQLTREFRVRDRSGLGNRRLAGR
jgi:hypothetical protein